VPPQRNTNAVAAKFLIVLSHATRNISQNVKDMSQSQLSPALWRYRRNKL